MYRTELALEEDKRPESIRLVREAIDEYLKLVTPNKKGERWERVRLNRFKTYSIARIRIGEVTPNDMAKWRDKRLGEVSAPSVKRELGLWSSLFTTAWKEWGWIKTNPCFEIRKPINSAPRYRTITETERAMLLVKLRRSKVKLIFELALETGMRVSEMTTLTPERVMSNYVVLGDTKNNTRREVPLSTKAKDIVKHVPFGITSGSVTGIFAKAVNDLGIDNLTFHDTRHTAATHLAKKFNLLELCRIFGWKDPKNALIYFNPSAADLAEKL